MSFDWLKPYFYNYMENMERFTPMTPLYAIVYPILNGADNLHFDKEGYFHILVFYGLFYKRNRKHFFFRVPIRYRNTRESLGELEIAWKHVYSPYGLVRLQFLVLPNFYSCFYNYVIMFNLCYNVKSML